MTRAEMPTTIDGLRERVFRQQALLEDQRSEIETQSEVLDANRSTIESNATLIDEQAELITFYREWKRLIDSQRFGSSSEKLSAEQGHLFNEAEIEAAASVEIDKESEDVAVPAHTRKKRGRRPGRGREPRLEPICQNA